MFCGECGTENPDTNRFCRSCGRPLKQKQQPAPAVAPSPAPAGPATPGPATPKGNGRKKTWIIAGAIIALVVLAVAVVLLQTGYLTVQVATPVMPIPGPVTGPFGGALFPGSSVSKPVHGTITSGPQAVAAQGSISGAGGTVAVNQPGSAINGLSFTAPAGAYPAGQQVTISSAPVTGHTFGKNFNPATPLIAISAGGGYANDPVLVTIPVAIPEDQFAMAFYYDDAAQKLEGIPTARQDEKSLTIATRHFSNIVVTFIKKGSLDSIATADSGFRPGTDDWEFTNDGSILVPKGHCAGQSATMLWYYTEQRQAADAPRLFNRYDNNGRSPASLQFERDDTLGYRFASVMQKNTDQMKYWNNPGSVISNVSDETTFREFKYSILLTGEPQFVTIFRNGGGHAIVCYEVSGNTLWIADPNYPGRERMIMLNGSTLGPYTSGASSTDIKQNGVRIYPRINYVAKTAMFSWPDLAVQYAKVKDGSVGAGSFPAYQILVIVTNDDGTEETFTLDAGTNTKVRRLDLKGKTVQIWPKSSNSAVNGGDIIVYNPDGSVLKTRPSNLNPLTLEEGSNLVAVELVSQNARSWVGFDWLDLNYVPPSPSATPAPATPPAPAAPSGQHYTSRVYAISSAAGCEQDAALAGLYSSGDPYCIPRSQLATASSGSIICGQPPAGCIDTTLYNHGIQAEHQYYIREGTNTANGEPVHNRIKDGPWTEWYVDGSVMDQWTYKDGVKVG